MCAFGGVLQRSSDIWRVDSGADGESAYRTSGKHGGVGRRENRSLRSGGCKSGAL